MQTRICQHCGSAFETVSGNKIYCDAECRNAATWPKRSKPRAPQVCVECGDTFTPDAGQQKRCRPCIDRNPLPPGLRPAPNWQEASCPVCGAAFTKKSPQQVYCAPECRKATRRVERECRTCKAPFHPVANQRYCKSCKPRMRWRKPKLYRQHKKSHCERCRFEPEHGCQLDVHHRDGDLLNNEIANLQTLCANCHRLESLGPRRAAA